MNASSPLISNRRKISPFILTSLFIKIFSKNSTLILNASATKLLYDSWFLFGCSKPTAVASFRRLAQLMKGLVCWWSPKLSWIRHSYTRYVGAAIGNLKIWRMFLLPSSRSASLFTLEELRNFQVQLFPWDRTYWFLDNVPRGWSYQKSQRAPRYRSSYCWSNQIWFCNSYRQMR